MVSQGRVELLAPAGNAEGFYGAVHAGADAVYLGGDRFGARAYAENFTTQELVECIRYGHLLGKRVYLTVNTLLKEEELEELSDYLYPFYEEGLDAVIVQDMGVLGFIRKHFPLLELHASTQMTICSHYGAGLLKEAGVSRIVPARELSLQELSEIRDRVSVELEAFIHGAMCYCYSGQCLFSSILGGRSGNRGRCAQPCRLPYQVGTDEGQSGDCYPLSLKDMCTIRHIPRLIGAGIDSFKIEGRMKRPKYAAGVTAVYRKYIDRYYELREQYGEEQAAERYQVSKEDLGHLSSLYIRSGIQDGYYFKQNGRDMVTMENPAYNGNDERLLEEIKNRYLTGRLKLPVTVTGSFVAGMPATVVLQAGGLSVTAQGDPVQRAQKQPVTEENIKKQLGKMGDSAFIPEEMMLEVGTDIFYPLKQMNELRREAVAKLEQLILEKNGYGAKSQAQTEFQAKTETQAKAETPAKTELQVKAELQVKPEPQAESEYQDSAVSQGTGDYQSIAVSVKEGSRTPEGVIRESDPPGIVASVRTFGQLQGLAGYFAERPEKRLKRLYIDGDLLPERTDNILSLCEGLREDSQIYIALPYILRQKDDTYLRMISGVMEKHSFFSGVLARSLDGLAYALKNGYPNRLDANVYCWNSMALDEMQAVTAGFCLPLELKAAEQKKLLRKAEGISGGGKFEKIVYGRIPMMVTANCLLKTTGGCRPESQKQVFLRDRYQKEFPVVRICRHCMNIIYNSVPLSLHQLAGEWREKAEIRLDFTVEPGGEVTKILEAFLENGQRPYGEYTTGHEKRGVK